MYTHISLSLCPYIYIYVCMCVYTCVCVCIYIYTHMYPAFSLCRNPQAHREAWRGASRPAPAAKFEFPYPSYFTLC